MLNYQRVFQSWSTTKTIKHVLTNDIARKKSNTHFIHGTRAQHGIEVCGTGYVFLYPHASIHITDKGRLKMVSNIETPTNWVETPDPNLAPAYFKADDALHFPNSQTELRWGFGQGSTISAAICRALIARNIGGFTHQNMGFHFLTTKDMGIYCW